MAWSIAGIGVAFVAATALLFVVYIALALHDMSHAAVRMTGGVLLSVGILGLLLQVSYVRWRLHKAEMALGQNDGIVFGQAAQNGQAECLD